MPVYLPAPQHNPTGPDGQGWNRLSIGWQPGNQCALRPTDWATLFESFDTRRARYGGFGPCTRNGDCGTCPVLAGLRTDRFTLDAEVIADEALVLVDDDGQPRVPTGKGYFQPVTWGELARLTGWQLGRRHPQGFWIVRTT